MADGFTFQGQLVYTPGVYGEVNVSELGGSGPTSRGIVAVLGEWARGGEPKKPRAFTSGLGFAQVYPARDATILSKLLFAPSKDAERIPNGAQSAVMIRVNPATRAQLELLDSTATVAATVQAADWGVYGNEIQVTVASGTVSGKKVTVVDADGVTWVKDNVGAQNALRLTYTATPGQAVATMLAAVYPNATGTSPAAQVTYSFTRTGGIAAFNPAAWMAFDGTLTFTYTDPGADKVIVVKGIDKVTGEATTESVTAGNGTTTVTTAGSWSEVTEIDISAMPATDVTVSGSAFALAANTYNTVQKVADRINTVGRGFAAVRLVAITPFAMSNMDELTAQDINGASKTFTANLWHFVTNATFSAVTITRAATGKAIVANSSAASLAGGTDGTAGTSDWTAGLLAAQAVNATHIVVLTGTEAVHSLVGDHVTYMNGRGRNERTAFVGPDSGEGFDDLYARIAALGSRNVTFCPQRIVIRDDTGENVTLEPCYAALLAAACDAGAKVDVGLTHASVDVVDVYDEPSLALDAWSVAVDRERLLQYGFNVIEAAQTGGWRWARGVTTNVADNNPFKCSIYANKNINLSLKNVRAEVEEFIGRGNAAVSSSVVRSAVVTELERQKAAREIREFDPKTVVAIPAGNAYAIAYSADPGEEIQFISVRPNMVRLNTTATA
jgi:hypothetical protein